MRTLDPERDWKTLVSYLPDDYQRLATEHRLLNTQWSNAKVSDAATLLRFILLHVGADLPLRQTVVTMARSGAPKLSQVWLHQKMRRARPYLAGLVERMTGQLGRRATPERWAGYEMLCLDGSTVSGPGAEGADARMHAVVRLHDLCVRNVLVTTAAEGETLRRFCWLPDDLVIVDRGYANAPGIVWAVQHGADVLVRVNRGALPVYRPRTDRTVDVLAWSRGLTGHRAAERPVYVVHGQGRRRRKVTGRLVSLRLPDKEAAQARERVRREQGPQVTNEQLEAAAYVMLFTTAPAARLSAARCIEAYRLRWQVQLQFKRWKSICHFDKLPNYRDDTIVSWLTAKVLLGLLVDRIGSTTLVSSSSRPLARQPWKLTAILWAIVVSTLMPIRLSHAADDLSALADELDQLDNNDSDSRQVATFRNRFFPVFETGATTNC